MEEQLIKISHFLDRTPLSYYERAEYKAIIQNALNKLSEVNGKVDSTQSKIDEFKDKLDTLSRQNEELKKANKRLEEKIDE